MIPFALLFAALTPGLQPPPLPPMHPALVTSYVPQRVYDTRQKGFTDFESMLADLTRADVVFVGEQHDDPNTHRLELAILEGLVTRHQPLVIAMEMFERDVQGILDDYLAGRIDEQQLLATARPWPRYVSDYRPIIEFAKAHQIPVIASDVPRPIAADVAKNGMSVIDALGARRSQAAQSPQCTTSGDYYERFMQLMGGHPPSGDPAAPGASAKNDRFFLAQCLKDETMGESIATAFDKYGTRHPTIVHINGAFHSDYGEGTAASARRRLAGRRIAVVSVLPVDNLDTPTQEDDDLKLGDYLLYTLRVR